MSGRWLVYDPYLASAGGGERYVFALADALVSSGHDVTIAGPAHDDALLQRMGLSSVAPIRTMGRLRFIARSSRYDATVVLANYPPLPSFARRSIVVVQFPFSGLHANPLRRVLDRRALRVSTFVVYSEFARSWLQRRWGVDAVIVPPPVVLGAYEPERKENLILHVGRFFPSRHSKRQDSLVDAFGAISETDRATWRLILAGGVSDDPDSLAYVADVRRRAKGLPVEVAVNIGPDALTDLYSRASIYWHATGLDRADDEPEKAEHFGISTVEAMSFGAVPVVIDDGGQREIVDATTGELWRTRDDLVRVTTALMGDTERRGALARRAAARAQEFSHAAFVERVRGLVGATT